MNWLRLRRTRSPGVPLYVPEVNIVGRTKKSPTSTTTGFNGKLPTAWWTEKSGISRSDGSEREDPIKHDLLTNGELAAGSRPRGLYEVSDRGRVRSLARTHFTPRRRAVGSWAGTEASAVG